MAHQSDVVPDSTLAHSRVKTFTRTDSEDNSTSSFSSSPTPRFPQPSYSAAATTTMDDGEDRPVRSRWANATTYRRKQPIADTEQRETSQSTSLSASSATAGSSSRAGPHKDIATSPQPRIASSGLLSRLVSASSAKKSPHNKAASILDDSDSEETDNNGASPKPSKFMFDFQRKMKAIDQEYDEKDALDVPLPVSKNPSSATSGSGVQGSIQEPPANDDQSADPGKGVDKLPRDVQHLFQTSSLTTLESTSMTSIALSPLAHKPSLPSAVATLESVTETESDDVKVSTLDKPKLSHRVLKKRRVQDSDSEVEPNTSARINKSLTPVRSPPVRNKAYTSPRSKRLSAITPAGSPLQTAGGDHTEPEDSGDVEGRTTRSARKSAGKSKKVKPLTKKQMQETEKESAKMWAERALPQQEKESHRIPVSDLFQKISSVADPKRMKIQPTFSLPSLRSKGIQSDPIETSSSPRTSHATTSLATLRASAAKPKISRSPDLSFEDPGMSRSMDSAASVSPLKTPRNLFGAHTHVTTNSATPSFDFGVADVFGEVLPQRVESPVKKRVPAPSDDDDDDEELPDVSELVRREEEAQMKAKQKAEADLKVKKLADLKKELAAKQAGATKAKAKPKTTFTPARISLDESDDELEVEHGIVIDGVPEEDSQESLQLVERIPGRAKTTERLRKIVLNDKLHPGRKSLSSSSPAKPPPEFTHIHSPAPPTDSQVVRAGKADPFGFTGPQLSPSKASASRKKSSGPGRKVVHSVAQTDLQIHLQAKVRSQAFQLRNEKKGEWVGRVGTKYQDDKSEQNEALQAAVKKGLEWSQRNAKEREDEEDEDDGEWNGEDEVYRGSVSPARRDNSQAPEGSEDGNESDMGEDKENALPLRNRRRSASTSISSSLGEHLGDLDDDIDDKENLPPSHTQDDPTVSGESPKERPSFPRRGSNSTASEGETDKENTFEGNENLPPPTLARRFTLEQADSDEDEENSEVFLGPGRRKPKRKPFRNVVMDDEDNEEALAPAPLAGLRFDVGFDDDDQDIGRPQLVFGLKSSIGKALFTGKNDATPSDNITSKFNLGDADAEMEGDGMTQLFGMEENNNSGFNALRKDISIHDVSLESQALLPAMMISTAEQIRDDSIFGEDQEARAVIERKEVMMAKRQQLAEHQYVNEDGFLTQTKPLDDALPMLPSPLFSRGSVSSQMQMPLESQASVFLSPPAEITPSRRSEHFTFSDEEDMMQRPLKRLVRRTTGLPTPTSQPLPMKNASSPGSTNVFDTLMNNAAKQTKAESRKKEKLKKSLFVEGEAEESDEEVIAGFGGPKERDEDDNEDDTNQVVEGLVDDAMMDAETENAGKVLEKVMEHQALDDAENTRIHQLAINGELRGRKRDRGVGLGESDSEEDDDDQARRARRAIAMKRKINGESLEQLAKNTKTLPFFNVYQQGVAVDDEDDLCAGASEADPLADADEQLDNAEEEEENDSEEEIITTSELNQKLREAARAAPQSYLDPNDVSWVDALDDEPESLEQSLVIKEVDHDQRRSRQSIPRVDMGSESQLGRHRLSLATGKNKSAKKPINRGRDDSQRTVVSGLGGPSSAACVTSHALKATAQSKPVRPLPVKGSASTKRTSGRSSLLIPMANIKTKAFDRQ